MEGRCEFFSSVSGYGYENYYTEVSVTLFWLEDHRKIYHRQLIFCSFTPIYIYIYTSVDATVDVSMVLCL